jgi:hypothetical protein
MDNGYLLSQSNDAKIAYAAGIFNGEGHIGYSMQPRVSGISYPSLRLTITQWYSTEILEQFKDIFGFGVVERNIPGNSNAFRYRLQAPDQISSCIKQMWPWLSEQKRSDASKTFKAYEEYLVLKIERMKFCKWGHDMSINEYTNSAGARQCRECSREHNRNYRKRKSNQ